MVEACRSKPIPKMFLQFACNLPFFTVFLGEMEEGMGNDVEYVTTTALSAKPAG